MPTTGAEGREAMRAGVGKEGKGVEVAGGWSDSSSVTKKLEESLGSGESATRVYVNSRKLRAVHQVARRRRAPLLQRRAGSVRLYCRRLRSGGGTHARSLGAQLALSFDQLLPLAVDEPARGQEVLDALGALALVQLLVQLALDAQRLVLVRHHKQRLVWQRRVRSFRW